MKQLAIAIASLVTSACTLGPTPELRVSKAEISATTEVKSILVAPTTGTGDADPEAKVNLSVPGGAYRRYRNKLFLQDGLSRAAKTLGMPESVATVLPIGWQVAFYKWVRRYAKLPEDRREGVRLAIKPPARGKKVPSKDEMDRLAHALKSRARGLKLLENAVKSGDVERLVKASNTAAKTLQQVESLNMHLFDRLGITYVLLSHLEGSEQAWTKNEPIRIYVALVNVQTGKFRYFAVNEGKKSQVPSTYEGFLDIMSINLFDEIAAEDEIEL